MSVHRKHYTSQQKVSILRRHLLDGVAVSDLCDEYALHPTPFYRWQKAFFENGATAFATQQSQQEKQWKQQIASNSRRGGFPFLKAPLNGLHPAQGTALPPS